MPSLALRLSAAKAAPDLARPQRTALSLSRADPCLVAGRSSTRDSTGRREGMPPKGDDTAVGRERAQVEEASRRRSWCGIRAVLDEKVPVKNRSGTAESLVFKGSVPSMPDMPVHKNSVLELYVLERLPEKPAKVARSGITQSRMPLKGATSGKTLYLRWSVLSCIP